MSIYESFRHLHYHPSNRIHPSAIVHKDVVMGMHNTIGPGCVIHPNVQMGNGNMLVGQCSIGSAPEHKDPKFHPNEPTGRVVIGENNIIREFVTINAPIVEEGVTQLGSRCYVMREGHIGHDAQVADEVIMSCNVVLGGHTIVMQGAYLGIHSATHPRTIIGAYAMVGMGAMVLSHVMVGVKVVGAPARSIGPNTIGLERAKVQPDQLKLFQEAYQKLLPPQAVQP